MLFFYAFSPKFDDIGYITIQNITKGIKRLC